MSYYKVIFEQKNSRNKPLVSILVPIRDDSRVYTLLNGLANQDFKKFEVIFVNDSSRPFIDTIKIPSNLNIKIIFSRKPLSIAEKLVLGSKYLSGEYYAITETDCVPGQTWLSECYSFIKGKKNFMLKGNEARNQDMSLANLVFTPSCIKECPPDPDFGYLSDVQWRRALELKGFKVENQNIGPMYHDLYRKGNYWKKTKRSLSDLWEYSYLYLKYPSSNFKNNFTWFLLNQLYNLFFSLTAFLLVLISFPYHWSKVHFSKK